MSLVVHMSSVWLTDHWKTSSKLHSPYWLVSTLMKYDRATGVTTAMVETMEASLKKDVLREVRAGKGRILLQDEVEERPGVFSIIPIWEHVSEADIMTPRDVFDLMTAEGYNVSTYQIEVSSARY